MQFITLALMFGLASSEIISDGENPPNYIHTDRFTCVRDGSKDYPDGKCVYPDTTGKIHQVYTCGKGAMACPPEGGNHCCPYFYHASNADCSLNCHSDVN